MLGKRLGHYEIVEPLGTGGMGEVYLAWDTRLDREIALKVLPPALASDEGLLRRLEREAKALAALDHPGIVTVFSVEEIDGIHFLTMARVRGATLAERIPPGGFPGEVLLELGAALADALRAAHEHGIVHRDLKPSNVMVDSEGRLRVLDFGLARVVGTTPVASELPTRTMEDQLTRRGIMIGTFPYMSPEQAEGRSVGQSSDIFSLGVVLYEMATGERPFQGDSTVSLLSSILRDTPPRVSEVRPDLPESFVRMVSRCLEKSPEDRPRSAAEVRDELELARRELMLASASHSATGGPRRTATALGAAAVVAVGLIVGLLAWRQDPLRRVGEDVVAEVTAPIRSLAVLPLRNLSGDADQEYFADGMTEALIQELAEIPALKVISRTSVMRFKNTDRSLPEIARELGVDSVVEGSVQREGDAVRILAQLIDAESDEQIWGEAFQRTLRGALQLQSEVAGSIAAAIAVEVGSGRGERATSREVDPEAYEAYLRGRHHLAKGTPEGIQTGMRLLNEAIDLDPTDPLPYAALADGYILLGHLTGEVEHVRRAKAAAQRSLDLDPGHAAALGALAEVAMFFEWDWEAAEEAFQRAARLDPNSADVHVNYGFLRLLLGDLEGASREVELAFELDPLSPLMTVALAELYWPFGLWDRAEKAARSALELEPDFARAHAWLSQALAGRGRFDEALEHARIAAAGGPRWVPWLGTILLAAGLRDEAGALLQELLANPDAGHTLVELAVFQQAFGDLEGALGSLEQAWEEREVFMPWIGSWFDWGELGEDARFRDLLDRMGLESVRLELLRQAASL